MQGQIVEAFLECLGQMLLLLLLIQCKLYIFIIIQFTLHC